MSLFRLIRSAIPVLAVLLAACSSTPPAPEPKKYPALPPDAAHLRKQWSVRVGEGVGEENVRLTPVVGEQHVAAASRDGVVVLVDRATGKPVWRHKTGLALVGGPALGYGMVAVATAKGELVAYSETDGAEKWRAALGATAVSAPAIASDTVVVLAGDGVVHALAREDGAARWTYNTSVPPLSLHGNAAPLLADNRVYVASAAGKIARIDLTTGIPDWELRVATNNGRTELERMNDIVADMIRVGDGELYSVGFQSQLTRTDIEAGRRQWTYDTSSVNDLAEGLGNIFLTDFDGNVLAVDRATGKSVWKQPDFAWRHLTNPVVLRSLLAVGDEEGSVHLLSQVDGTVQGRRSVGGSWFSDSPLVSLMARDDVLYAWDADGRLSAWTLK
ncbi:MAG TPA: outer membrane protein assembly factor BamB [Moraxellaceae bacterium]|nr:outer membrane protein assembly factor BamB [Moraxellaceae bacterium]